MRRRTMRCRSYEERRQLRELHRLVDAAERDVDRLTRRLASCGARQAEVRRRLCRAPAT